MGKTAGHVPAVRDEAVIARVRHESFAMAASQSGDHKAAGDALKQAHRPQGKASRS